MTKTYKIDGQLMTMRQIMDALPHVPERTIRSRVSRHGWRSFEALSAPPLPGRFSPWRKWMPK